MISALFLNSETCVHLISHSHACVLKGASTYSCVDRDPSIGLSSTAPLLGIDSGINRRMSKEARSDAGSLFSTTTLLSAQSV